LGLLIPLWAIVLWLGSGPRMAAVGDSPAPVPRAAAEEQRLFLPIVNTPRPLRVELQRFAKGFDTDTITDIAHAGDDRLFVAQREGLIRIVWPDGTIQPEPFLDITKDVTSNTNWEEGLLGVAFHPDYPNTPYFYIAYTDIRHIRVARVTVNPLNGNQALKNSLRFLMIIRKPEWGGLPSPVHNAGDLTFGPDGYLYIPTGDGGPDPYVATDIPGDPFKNSQRRDTMLGSILRIDVDQKGLLKADCGEGDYTIPPDNPFIGDSGCDEIWSTGLRNPWRIDFDPLNGNLFVADVGEWLREEINVMPAGLGRGANYGWNCYEGTVDYRNLSKWEDSRFDQYFTNCGPREDYVFPAHEYDHSRGECSLTGGVVYRGQEFPFFSGRYLYSDFCSGRIWTLTQDPFGGWVSQQVGQTSFPLTTYGRDVNGEVYAGMRDPKGLTDGDVTLFKIVVK
jgi:glucose/arabinose dehydrogenase